MNKMLPLFSSVFELALFCIFLRNYVAIYHPNLIVTISFECIKIFSFLETQMNQLINQKNKKDTSLSYKFLLFEYLDENGEYQKFEVPTSTWQEGKCLDASFFNLVLKRPVTASYNIRFLDHNVVYQYIHERNVVVLASDTFTIINNLEKEKEEEVKSQTSDDFEEFSRENE